MMKICLVCSYLMASVPLYITGSACEIKAEKHDQVHLESKLSHSSLVSVSRAEKHSLWNKQTFLKRDTIWWLKLHGSEHSVKNAAAIRHQNLNRSRVGTYRNKRFVSSCPSSQDRWGCCGRSSGPWWAPGGLQHLAVEIEHVVLSSLFIGTPMRIINM